MEYESLKHTLQAVALTVPAARAYEMTVEFALTQGRDTATVFRLEDHFRERPSMTACIERMKKDPAASRSWGFAGRKGWTSRSTSGAKSWTWSRYVTE